MIPEENSTAAQQALHSDHSAFERIRAYTEAKSSMTDQLVPGYDEALPEHKAENRDDVSVNKNAVSTNEAVDKTMSMSISRTAYLVIKRVFDFVFSLLLSIILLIPMIVIAILIMVKDPGNPFYVQKRVGQNGKTLHLYKFRSMRKGADDLEKMLTPEQLRRYRREFKLEDDPRLIGYKKAGDGDKCFGAKLRILSIDELPQLFFNILLKGDMSVVGPRPILQDELETNYSAAQQKRLLSAKPGLTGFWQAYARNNANYESGKRQDMELFYVDHIGITWDIKIMFATVSAVIKKRGAN
ncbi:MAG: sugar transferase [Aminipila sp.]